MRQAQGAALEKGPQDLPLAAWQDLVRLVVEAVGYFAAGTTPARWDKRALRWTASIRRSSREAESQRVARRMELLLGPGPAAWREEAAGYLDMRFEQELGRWRSLHRRAWQIETDVGSKDRLLESISSGAGAILWGMAFCGTLPVKVSLSRAGLPIVHLSTWRHGLPRPGTKLGLRTVARLHVKAENRYIAERVVIPPGGGIGYLRALIRHVEKGHCVFMSGVRTAPLGNVEVQVFGRSALLATGPPHLAWATGAVLCPVSVIRMAPGRYRAMVHPAIQRGSCSDRGGFVREAAETFAALLESSVRAQPANWDWDSPWTSRLLANSPGGSFAA